MVGISPSRSLRFWKRPTERDQQRAFEAKQVIRVQDLYSQFESVHGGPCPRPDRRRSRDAASPVGGGVNPARPRIVLIGCGDIAQVAHLPALAALRAEGVLELAGVCDLDAARAEAAASKFAVASWGTDWQRLVRDVEAEAVAVVVLPGPNAEISIAALEMGLHVLCEKPPGRDESQARRMAEAARGRPDRVTMVAFNRRHAPLYRKARERSLSLGPVHSFVARFTRGALGQAPSNSARDWVSSDGSHALDLAVATVGFPQRVSVARRGVGTGPDNAWLIQLSGESGQASVWLDFAAGRRLERFEWAGPGYDVSLELPERGNFAGREGSESWTAAEVSGSPEFFVNYGFLDEHRCFAEAVAGRGARPDSDFEYGARFMQLVGQILAMPPEEAGRSVEERRVAAADAVAPPMPAREPSGFRGRPVVSVLQTPEAARKYFPPATLAELSAFCDLRYASGSDTRRPSAIPRRSSWAGERHRCCRPRLPTRNTPGSRSCSAPPSSGRCRPMPWRRADWCCATRRTPSRAAWPSTVCS